MFRKKDSGVEGKKNSTLSSFIDSRESGDPSMLAILPAVNFDATISPKQCPVSPILAENNPISLTEFPDASEKQPRCQTSKSGRLITQQFSSGQEFDEDKTESMFSFDYFDLEQTRKQFFVPERADAKDLEFYARRCLQLEEANGELNEKLIQNELEKERCILEVETLKQELAEVLKIPNTMLTPGTRSARPSRDRNSREPCRCQLEPVPIHKLKEEWGLQRHFLLAQLNEQKKVLTKTRELISGNSLRLMKQLEVGIDALETRFSQQIRGIKKTIDHHQDESVQKVNDLAENTSIHEKGYKIISKDLEQLSHLISEDMSKLETLLQKSQRSEKLLFQEKQMLLRKAESAAKSLEESLDSVTRLKHGMSVEKSTNLELANRVELLETEKQDLAAEMNSRAEILLRENKRLKQELRQCPSKPTDSCDDSATTLERHRHSSSVFSRSSSGFKTKLNLDSLTRENSQLRREIVEISEELVDLKEHSATLESELKEERDASSRYLVAERNLKSIQDANRDLKTSLGHKQKIINSLKTALTNLRSEARQHGLHMSGRGFGSEVLQETEISLQVDAVLEAERCYRQLEKLHATAQAERDYITSRHITLESQLRSLQKKYGNSKRGMDALKRENTSLKRSLSCARSEIATLQTNLRVESTKRVSSRKKTMDNVDSTLLMQELVKSKVELAEMHEVVIRLRNEICKAKPRMRFAKTLRGKIIRAKKANREKQSKD